MKEKMTPPESVAVLCLLTVGADKKIRLEEITSMIQNSFFQEHVMDKISPHHSFLERYKQALKMEGPEKLEARAIAALSSDFTALKLKTVALMLLIAEADGEFDDMEKALIGRVAKSLKLNPAEAQTELQKMKKAVLTEKQEKDTTD